MSVLTICFRQDVQFLYLQHKRAGHATDSELDPVPAPAAETFAYETMDVVKEAPEAEIVPAAEMVPVVEASAAAPEMEKKHEVQGDPAPVMAVAAGLGDDESDSDEERDYSNLVDSMVQRFETLGAR
jgi:hypothetical protein